MQKAVIIILFYVILLYYYNIINENAVPRSYLININVKIKIKTEKFGQIEIT